MSNKLSIPKEIILGKIHEIRGKKVMLSTDLAELYKVETKRLNEQVKRNIGRFSERYMFKLTTEEYRSLRSHFATLEIGKHSKHPPYAFTEHGVLMLATVLRSDRADMVNMIIVDTFIEVNEMLLTHKDLLLAMKEIRKMVTGHDDQIKVIFEYLKQLEEIKHAELEQKERKEIGFKSKKK
ncbi:MAG: ORF6N domain-containing protein [Bacteroidetes bacterium]|nr:ORF6N domain-containing protein [Bacteroidota bacterium]